MLGQRASNSIENSCLEVASASFPRTSAHGAQIDPQLQRKIEKILALPVRPLAEMLLEFRERFGTAWIDERLGQYASLDPAQLRAVGADQWPQSFVVLRGGRRDA